MTPAHRSVDLRPLALALLIAALQPAAAVAAEPAKGDGRAAYDRGDFAAALPLLEQLGKEHPADGVIAHQHGVSMEMTGKKEAGKKRRLEALVLLEKQASSAPTVAVLYYLAGDYQIAGKPDQARATMERAAKLHADKKLAPAGPAESYQLAAMLENLGRAAEVEPLLAKSLEGFRKEPAPNRRYFSETLVRLGNLDFERKDAAAAHAKFDEALKIDPKNPGAHYVAGVVADAEARGAEAASFYEKALELEPGHFYARFNLANLYARQGRIRDAMTAFEKALETGPSGDDLAKTLLALAQLSESAAEHRHAADYYKRLGQLRPSPQAEMSSRYAEAHALLQEGKSSEALVVLRELVGKAPDMAQLHAEIANLLMGTKDYAGATTALMSAIALVPRDGRLYLALGSAYLAQGKMKDAESAYTKALDLPGTREEAEQRLASIRAAGAAPR